MEPEPVTTDRFLGGLVTLRQPKRGHRAGLDAALLQATVPIEAKGLAYDLGAGVGPVAMCVAARASRLSVIGAEIDEDLVGFANLALEAPANRAFAGRVNFIRADVTAEPSERGGAGLKDGAADWVLMNPPFEAEGRSRPSPDATRRRAHVAAAGALSAWLRCAGDLLRPKGRLTLIHRADSLGDVLAALPADFGGLSVLPVYPRSGAPATRILVGAVKGSRAPLAIRPGLILHEEDGGWTPEADAVLHGRRGLDL